MLNNLVFIFSSKILIASLLLPWLRFILPSYTGYNKRLEILSKLRTFIYREIEKHEAELDEDNPKDYIDVFLIERSIVQLQLQYLRSVLHYKDTIYGERP